MVEILLRHSGPILSPTVPTPWKLFPLLFSKSVEISGTTLLVIRRYRTSPLVNVVERFPETSL